MNSWNRLEEIGTSHLQCDIGDARRVKGHIDQLHQSVHHSPKSTSNVIDDYYYQEPVTPVQDVDPVPQTAPPRPLEEE